MKKAKGSQRSILNPTSHIKLLDVSIGLMFTTDLEGLWSQRVSLGFYGARAPLKKIVASISTTEKARICSLVANDYKKELRSDKTIMTSNKGKKSGFIYLLKVNDWYKIGITSHPQKRLSFYLSESPYEYQVVVLQYVKNPRELERKIIKQYNQKNDRKEWFHLSSSQIEEIETEIKHMTVESN